MIPIILGTIVSIILLVFVYGNIGIHKIIDCYRLWFKKEYWTDYNIVEALSWFTKALIIVPGLVFGVQLWWLYFLTLATSLTLIWASNKKLLPTLVGFNTLWTWISCVVIAQYLFKLL